MPSKKQTLADKARKQTATGQQRIATEQAAMRENERQEDERLQQQMRQRAERLFAECQEKIATAARDARTQTQVSVMQWEREPYPKWCWHLVRYTRELLENEGFNVEEKRDKTEPVGSDPMFFYTVHSVYLLISWDKPKHTSSSAS